MSLIIKALSIMAFRIMTFSIIVNNT
jgi:hypothetical protein